MAPKLTTDSSTFGGEARLLDAYRSYAAALEEVPDSVLSRHTKRNYAQRIRRYLAWLGSEGPRDFDPLDSADGRSYAAADYRAHLLTVAKLKPKSVSAHTDALVDFYDRRHTPLPKIARERQDPPPPRALDAAEQRAFLRAAGRASVRDRAMCHVLFYCGLRIGELVALDVGDVQVSRRSGVVVVRHGKGQLYREVPARSEVRDSVRAWLAERAELVAAEGSESALFLSARRRRPDARTVYAAVRRVAADAGLEVGGDGFTPHSLRHTLGTTLARQGVDLVIIAATLGHSVEQARRYAAPTRADQAAALDALPAAHELGAA